MPSQLVPTELPPIRWTPQELDDLRWAHRHLEHPSFAARLSNVLGTPIEGVLTLMPHHWQIRLRKGVERVLLGALEPAIASMRTLSPPNGDRLSQAHVHKGLVAATGFAGGFFGPLGVLAELPITTTLMLRAIADMAHHQGEDLSTLESRLACVEVFALGGRAQEDDAAEAGYFGLRMSLGLHFSTYSALGGGSGVPAALNALRAVAARFGLVISEKAAVQMIPVAGALTGATINLLFMQHFQDMARGHFIIRRLERTLGTEAVREAYEQLTREEKSAAHAHGHLERW